MSKLIIYKVVGRTAPFDYAEQALDEDIALFQTRESAEKQIKILKSRSDWRMSYSRFTIKSVKVLP